MNCKACGGLLVETATRGSAGWYTIHQCAMCGRSPENLRRVDENSEISRIRQRAKAAANGEPVRLYEPEVEIKASESTHQDNINDSSTYQDVKPEPVTASAPAPVSSPPKETLVLPRAKMAGSSPERLKEATCEKTLTFPVPAPVPELVDEPASEPVPEPSVNSLPEEASHTEKEAIPMDPILMEEGQELRRWRLDEAGLTGLDLASKLRHPKTKRPPHASVISAWELGKQAIPEWAREQMTKIRGWDEKKDAAPSESRPRTLDTKDDEKTNAHPAEEASPIYPFLRDEYYCEIPLATLEAFADLARTLAPLGWEKLTICRR